MTPLLTPVTQPRCPSSALGECGLPIRPGGGYWGGLWCVLARLYYGRKVETGVVDGQGLVGGRLGVSWTLTYAAQEH